MDIVAMLREKSRAIAPDYPGINNDLEPWEHLWAITSSYEGCSMANDDMHKLVGMLCAKLNITPLEAWEEWKREQTKQAGS